MVTKKSFYGTARSCTLVPIVPINAVNRVSSTQPNDCRHPCSAFPKTKCLVRPDALTLCRIPDSPRSEPDRCRLQEPRVLSIAHVWLYPVDRSRHIRGKRHGCVLERLQAASDKY